MLPGDIVFKLYDTFGFPLELTRKYLKKKAVKLMKKDSENLWNSRKKWQSARNPWIRKVERGRSFLGRL